MKNFNTIMALIFGAALLTGCATTQMDIANAAGRCFQNGGVSHILPKYNSTARVVCNDGAHFTIPKEIDENEKDEKD